MENFIPPVETEKVISRAVYSEEEEDWKLKPYQAPSARFVHRTLIPVHVYGSFLQ